MAVTFYRECEAFLLLKFSHTSSHIVKIRHFLKFELSILNHWKPSNFALKSIIDQVSNVLYMMKTKFCRELLRLVDVVETPWLLGSVLADFFLFVFFFKIKTNMAVFRLFQDNLLIFLKWNFDEVWIVRKKLLKQKLFIHIISLMSHSFTAEMWFVWWRECPNLPRYLTENFWAVLLTRNSIFQMIISKSIAIVIISALITVAHTRVLQLCMLVIFFVELCASKYIHTR